MRTQAHRLFSFSSFFSTTAVCAAALLLSACGGTSDSDDASSAGLTGTWCANVSSNQNCWVFDNDTGSSSGSFYQQSINQYAGTLTNRMTWSATSGSLTYRFTRSTLTNSSSNYDQAVNVGPYTFPYTVTSSTFTFQGIAFTRK